MVLYGLYGFLRFSRVDPSPPGCLDESAEVNSRVRFQQQWQDTSTWSVPEAHLKKASKDIAKDGEQAVTYGFQMYKNDWRRVERLAIFMHERLRESLPWTSLKPEATTEQTGVLLLKSQAYRHEMEQALGKGWAEFEGKHLQPIPDTLKAMTELLEAVTRSYKVVSKVENFKTFVSPEIFEFHKSKLLPQVNTEDALARLPKKVREMFYAWLEAHKDTKEPLTISFTKFVVEYWQWCRVGQTAKDLVSSKDYEKRRLLEESTNWAEEDEENTKTIKVFAEYDPEEARAIEVARTEYEQDFEESVKGHASWFAYKYRKTTE